MLLLLSVIICYGAGKLSRLKSLALSKGIRSDAADAVSEGNFGNADTSGKCIFTHVSESVREYQFPGYSFTNGKCAILDVCKCFRKACYESNATAAGKC